jgi:hypothetical protein
MAGLACAVLVGVFTGRTVLAQQPELAPTLGELRPAPNAIVEPLRHWSSLSDTVVSADAIGLVRVESVAAIKEQARVDDITKLEVANGRADVKATVLATFRGSNVDLAQFAFDAFFVPGTNELAAPAVQPPLDIGGEYLVFLKGGRIVYPGGTYKVAKGRVWYVGQWSDAGSREYPPGLSGLTPNEVGAAIRQLLQGR